MRTQTTGDLLHVGNLAQARSLWPVPTLAASRSANRHTTTRTHCKSCTCFVANQGPEADWTPPPPPHRHENGCQEQLSHGANYHWSAYNGGMIASRPKQRLNNDYDCDRSRPPTSGQSAMGSGGALISENMRARSFGALAAPGHQPVRSLSATDRRHSERQPTDTMVATQHPNLTPTGAGLRGRVGLEFAAKLRMPAPTHKHEPPGITRIMRANDVNLDVNFAKWCYFDG